MASGRPGWRDKGYLSYVIDRFMREIALIAQGVDTYGNNNSRLEYPCRAALLHESVRGMIVKYSASSTFVFTIQRLYSIENLELLVYLHTHDNYIMTQFVRERSN